MSSEAPRLTLLAELDSRQDDVLAQLEALNARIEHVLQEFTTLRPATIEARAA